MSSLLAAIEAGIKVYDLGREYRIGMPQSPNHPPYWHTLPRRHGDSVRSDGGSASNDYITMGTHVGTHIDALAHVSHDGYLHGGIPANDDCVGGRFATMGAHTIPPMAVRGILLDVPTAIGSGPTLPGGFEITSEHLEATAHAQGTDPEGAGVIFVRSGWARRFDVDDPVPYVGRDSGVPGVAEEGAVWLAERGPKVVGADSIAFERLAPGAGHSLLPAHRVLLVDRGIHIVEALNLEELAADRHYEFTVVLAPLNLYGATGAPVRPLALVEAS